MFYDDGTEMIHYGKKTTFEEIISLDDEDTAFQFGVKYRSGRYPYGSGENPYQHDGRRHVFGSDKYSFDTGREFINEINRLRAEGKSDRQVAEHFGLKLKEYKTETAIARAEIRREDYGKVKELSDQGLSATEIGRMLGKNESSIRTLLNNDKAMTRMHKAEETANQLKSFLDEKDNKDVIGVDVGPGSEIGIGINRNKMDEALYICQMDDYPVYAGRFKTSNPKNKTTTTVLCRPGTEHREIFEHPEKIALLDDELYSHDGGETFDKVQYPKSIDSKRIKINYAETGGTNKDGVIEIRRGVRDLDLDGSNYAQVRIAVDDTHYLKGMAVYSDNIPDGYDIIFNTNKTSDVPMKKVLKEMKTNNPDNPFGANIKKPSAGGQHYYEDENGKRQLSAINKVKDEGDWSQYSDTLAAQFLSKQPMKLINQQLDETYKEYSQRYAEINELTNPTVKRNRLMELADTCDGAAVHLKAAALPRQSWQVILPSETLKDTEVYAPNYDNGERVALVRYPHGGIFELPILTVNNNNKECEKNYKGVRDAVAINSNVAGILSGADFDGDTVLVIPTGPKSNIKNRKPLEGLQGFEPKVEYATREVPLFDDKGKPVLDKKGNQVKEYYSEETGKKIKVMKNTQTEMGKISNLITDMTLQGATDEHLERAVRHSMVVIDAEKHKLDYKKSYEDNGIKELKDIYQGHYTEDGRYSTGAASLISAAKSPATVNERIGQARINYDPETKGPRQPHEYTSPRDGVTRIDAPPEGTPLGGIYYVESGRTYLQAYNPDSKKWVSAYKDKKTGDVYYKTGEKKDESTGKLKNTYTKATSDIRVKEVPATQESKKLAETRDAYSLSSGTPEENAYAAYSNKMKALANTIRITALDTKDVPYSREAADLYKDEVTHLKAQVARVEAAKPRERRANRIATAEADAARANDPEMSNGEYKKLLQQRLEAARASLGGKKPEITISDQEWKAIQAGAVNKTTLEKILDATPSETIDKLAMPRDNVKLTASQISRMKNLRKQGASLREIALQYGISISTVENVLKGGS